MLTKPNANTGFTLVEIIIGILVLAIALLVITSALGPLYQKSADPWHQVRAAELGHSLLNEIMARSFDENSDRTGGEYRCGEAGAEPCTSCNALGPEESQRDLFNDVDDFAGLALSDSDIVASSGDLALTRLYHGYQANVSVSCAGADLSVADEQVKRVTVTITTPTGQELDFSAYRSNW
jgi:MSHA pilin protein MshD